MKKDGGKYRGVAGMDSVMFNVYTNVHFISLTPDRRGITVLLSVAAPPGGARSNQARARAAFWENMGGKRLLQGGLVALVWKSQTQTSIHLGIIASPLKDITDWVRRNDTSVGIRISFFDPAVELGVLQVLKRPELDAGSTRLLIEAPVMFEAIRPFLEALRRVPESIPFSRYLVHRPPEYLRNAVIDPPAYTKMPDFAFQLASLFPEAAGINDLKLSPSDSTSVDTARQMLRTSSRLDPSQADAVVEALTRELVLIQGPPGTGKVCHVHLSPVIIADNP